MPSLQSADISSKFLQELGDASVVGPILMGMKKPVQIISMHSSVSEILNLSVLASNNVLD